MGERQQDISKLLQSMGTSVDKQINTAIDDSAKVVAEVRSRGILIHSADTVSSNDELAIARLDLLSAFNEAHFNLFSHVLLRLVTIQSTKARFQFCELGLKIRQNFDQLATRFLASKIGDDFSLYGMQLSSLYESISKEIINIQF